MIITVLFGFFIIIDLIARLLGSTGAEDFTLDSTTGITISSGGTATITISAPNDLVDEDLEVFEISIENADIATGMTMTIFPWKAQVFITDVPRKYNNDQLMLGLRLSFVGRRSPIVINFNRQSTTMSEPVDVVNK